MAVTRSTASERIARRADTQTRPAAPRGLELLALLMATVVVGLGLWLVYRAKSEAIAATPPKQQPLNLTTLDRQEQLLPALAGSFANPGDRQFAARKIYDYMKDHNDSLPNIGALGRLAVSEREVRATPRVDVYKQRLAELKKRHPESEEIRVPLFTPAELAAFKHGAIIRTPRQFTEALALWAGLFFLAFYVVHGYWRLRGFEGEVLVLPLLHLLTGAGLVVMVSLRDPLRDTLLAVAFAQGVALSLVVMAAASQVDYARLLSRLSYVPLLASFLLSLALMLFGSGPGVSDAKVNLGPFQPVEAIKILLVLFLAGYFASRWELLRELKERRPELARVTRWFDVPRLEYLVPVLACVVVALLFFFFQKDLGPALVFTCVFLAMYAVARKRVTLAALGLVVLMAGFAGGYLLKTPRTVRDRVDMWLSPWDNRVHGGEQVVHSLWALASGGAEGMGLGLGQPEVMPAAHTDLVLAALGEEWGFGGILGVYLMFGVLIWFGIRTARRAPNDYSFFLALGLTLLVAGELLLISGGILDLVPLSGVVTPFLSYGRSAMLANFAVFGILLSISQRALRTGDQTAPFHSGLRWVTIALAVMGVAVVAKAAWVQVARPDLFVGAGTLTVQADGQRRYVYNPRLMAIARSIPRGTIFDRNGLPLATSDWALLEKYKDAYTQMGVNLETCCARADTRFYPLGGAAFHLLGDVRTRANWAASNSSLQERDSQVRLQGYDDRARVVEIRDDPKHPTYSIRYDYRELVPLLRHRHEPDHPAVRRVLERRRDIKMSIDARLQLKVERILAARLKELKREAGAAVVLDPATGDLLAAASYPLPDAGEEGWLDRARYGLYPPGSTFKVVTAAAALRKDPTSAEQTYQCQRLPDGRVGNYVKGWSRPIRDDIADKTPHGTVNMERGLVVSCNAYFAQLATFRVGAAELLETARLWGISVASPATAAKLHDALPQAGYGQGQVVASPFQMARVAATVAAAGKMPYGRWVIDETNPRVQDPQTILAPNVAAQIGRYMRGVVTSGTGRGVGNARAPIAGKTGTAELSDEPSHAWFIGYAPYQGARRIAFSVLIENGRYGGSAAAPAAAEIVNAAAQLGLLEVAPAAASAGRPGETSQ
jgi:cell division protein FtsW (lipid II flippase)